MAGAVLQACFQDFGVRAEVVKRARWDIQAAQSAAIANAGHATCQVANP
jgi:hypothetical protein